MNINIDKVFQPLENNALYRMQLIKRDAGSILGDCTSKTDVIYLLEMIYAFLMVDNFLVLEPTLLYKVQLLLNLIKVKKEYRDLLDDIGWIEEEIRQILPSLSSLVPQNAYLTTHFEKYRYPRLCYVTSDDVLANLAEHYQVINTIKRLDEPTSYFGKMSFLEVLNFSVSGYRVHEASYDLRDYYIDVVDFFTKDFKMLSPSSSYKKYLRQTRRFIKREVI